jgi:hypothetical protein
VDEIRGGQRFVLGGGVGGLFQHRFPEMFQVEYRAVSNRSSGKLCKRGENAPHGPTRVGETGLRGEPAEGIA